MADPLLLVVEGINDLHVICAILKRHSFQPHFKVHPEGSDKELLRNFPVRLKQSDLERLGIVVDADTDAAARWQSIKDILKRSGYVNVPERPEAAGTVVEHEILPRVGVWIMPDNLHKGMIEDFLSFLVPEDDTLIDRARASLDGIPVEERRFPAQRRTKALIHTWLAWQKEPGKPMGQAITATYFDTDDPRVAVFLAWLTRVFA